MDSPFPFSFAHLLSIRCFFSPLLGVLTFLLIETVCAVRELLCLDSVEPE